MPQPRRLPTQSDYKTQAATTRPLLARLLSTIPHCPPLAICSIGTIARSLPLRTVHHRRLFLRFDPVESENDRDHAAARRYARRDLPQVRRRHLRGQQVLRRLWLGEGGFRGSGSQCRSSGLLTRGTGLSQVKPEHARTHMIERGSGARWEGPAFDRHRTAIVFTSVSLLRAENYVRRPWSRQQTRVSGLQHGHKTYRRGGHF